MAHIGVIGGTSSWSSSSELLSTSEMAIPSVERGAGGKTGGVVQKLALKKNPLLAIHMFERGGKWRFSWEIAR